MSMPSALTEKQQAVLTYVEQYQLSHGSSPTLKEIRTFLKVSSDNSVLKHLDALEHKGYLNREDTPRGIGLLESVRERLAQPLISLPLLGSVPAGNAVSIEENTERMVSVTDEVVRSPKHSFVLRVRGDSMIDAGIHDGDLVVVRGGQDPRHGDIVVALIDNENTVKRFIRESGKAYLRAENPRYPDMYPAHELVIQGVVTGLVRSY